LIPISKPDLFPDTGIIRKEWMELRDLLVYDKNKPSGVIKMKQARKVIDPEDYILSVLSPEDRLDAALKIAREAFKGTKLTMRDINSAVKLVRRKAYGGEEIK